MTRPLFLCTALAGMLTALTAVLIRVELAYPYPSALFMDNRGFDFQATVDWHGVFAMLAVLLLGTTMASAARRKGAFAAGFWMWLGLIVSALTTVGLLIVILAPNDVLLAWLAPLQEIVPTDDPGLLGNVDPFGGSATLLRILALPAAGMLFMGAYLMAATQPAMGWLAPVGAATIVIMTLLLAPQMLVAEPALLVASYITAALPLLVAGAVRLTDAPTGWLMILIVGLLACIIGLICLLSLSSVTYIAGTTAEIAPLYVFPLGFAFYALPAFILFSRDADMTAGSTLTLLAALTGAFAFWILPWTLVGIEGQATQYSDYPSEFADENLIISTAVFVFVLTILGSVIFARRAR